MRRRWNALKSPAKVLLLMATMFYAGYLFDAYWERVFYGSPLQSPVAAHGAAEEESVVPTPEYTPIALEHSATASVRGALAQRIFGTEQASMPATLSELSVSAFASEFAGAAFDEYYREIFADRMIELSEIHGTFTEIAGYTWRTILLRQRTSASAGLFIYHHGHDGSPFSFRPPNMIIRTMLERGYDVAVLCMPGIGWNGIGRVRIKTWDGSTTLAASRNESHKLFSMIDTGDGHFIKFFLRPVLSSIDVATAQKAYDKIMMLGHSGGGWTATLAAAMDLRIDVSVSYAGTLPFFARLLPRDLGDIEQTDAGFYRDFPYTLLYELASASDASHRVHYQVFNTDDSCCFGGKSAESFLKYIQARPLHPKRDLRFIFVRNKGHHIMPDAVLKILEAAPGVQKAKR